jgi:hypothetical protein
MRRGNQTRRTYRERFQTGRVRRSAAKPQSWRAGGVFLFDRQELFAGAGRSVALDEPQNVLLIGSDLARLHPEEVADQSMAHAGDERLVLVAGCFKGKVASGICAQQTVIEVGLKKSSVFGVPVLNVSDVTLEKQYEAHCDLL